MVGSFLQDKVEPHENLFYFKHHYMNNTMDSDVMACLFDAIQQKRYITADCTGRHTGETRSRRLVPLKLYISAQNGRQNLIAYHETANRLHSYRLNHMSNVKAEVLRRTSAIFACIGKAPLHFPVLGSNI